VARPPARLHGRYDWDDLATGNASERNLLDGLFLYCQEIKGKYVMNETPNVAPSEGIPLHSLPDHLRCVALKKVCVCGYHFRRADLYAGAKKFSRRKPPPPCPQCGRPRQRCRKAKVRGAPTCRSHGAKGIAKRAYIPGYMYLDDEQIQTLEDLMKEDDQSLKREFHLLRLYFGDAIAQLQASTNVETGTSSPDIIGELRRLAAVADRMSSIIERRARVSAMTPREEQVVRVEFDNPRIQYFLKERIRRFQSDTIRRILAVVLASADPDGKLGLAQKLPSSFAPFLPSGNAANQPDRSEDEQSDESIERPFAAVDFPGSHKG